MPQSAREPQTEWTRGSKTAIHTPWAIQTDTCDERSWWSHTDGTNFSDGTAYTDTPYPVT